MSRDHRGGPDARLGEQDVLDFPRVDLLAAPVDHVVGPAGQEQVAVLVEVAQVAGVEPALGVDGTGRAVLRVFGDDAPAPDLHPAHHRGRAGHVPPGGQLGYPDLRAGRRPTEPAFRRPSSGLAAIMLAASVIP